MDTKSVPIDRREVPCTFNHGQLAIAGFSMPRGCAAYPKVTSQDLCSQHIVKAEPIGAMNMTVIYDPEALKFLNASSRP